jgi:hypothetical protein
VELDALAELEPPGGLAFELPLCGQARVELAVRVAACQVVKQVEGDADVVRRRAVVGVEL